MQISHMTATLEKYQQENQKIVINKDKEIEALQDQLSKIQSQDVQSKTQV